MLGGSGGGRLETVAEFTIELVPPYLTITGRAMSWRVRLDRIRLVVDGDWIELGNVVDSAGEFLRINVAGPADRGAAERIHTTVESWRRRMSDGAGGPVPPPAAAGGPPARIAGMARVPQTSAPAEAPAAEAPAAEATATEWSTKGSTDEEEPAGSRLRISQPERPPPARAPEPSGPRPPDPESVEPGRTHPPARPPPPICGPPVIEHTDDWLAFAPLPDTWALSRGELFEPEGGL